MNERRHARKRPQRVSSNRLNSGTRLLAAGNSQALLRLPGDRDRARLIRKRVVGLYGCRVDRPVAFVAIRRLMTRRGRGCPGREGMTLSLVSNRKALVRRYYTELGACMSSRIVKGAVVRLGILLERARDSVAARTLPEFSGSARDLVIQLPREVTNPTRIYLGDGVKLGPNCVLKATTRFPGGWLRHPQGDDLAQTFEPTIHLGDRVTSTGQLHIAAYDNVTIEDDVMFATNVYISDGSHGIATADTPYKFQAIERILPVRVGRGSWIGQNVVITPGVTIGELCVIGANSVVTKSIPPQSIAVGAPARVVKRWNAERKTWEDAR